MKLALKQVMILLIIEGIAILLTFLIVNVALIANNLDTNDYIMGQLAVAFSLYTAILLLATADTFLLRLCIAYWQKHLVVLGLQGVALVCTAAMVLLAVFDPQVQGWQKNIFAYMVFGVLTVMCVAIHAFWEPAPIEMNRTPAQEPEPQANPPLVKTNRNHDAN